jgi:hypothetical protein
MKDEKKTLLKIPSLTIQDDLDDLDDKAKGHIKTIIAKLNLYYNFIIKEPKQDKKSEYEFKDNKYINYGKISDILKDNKVITDDELNTLAISILLDDLDFNDSVLLVIYLLNNDYAELSKFEKDLLTYYTSEFLETNNGKLKALYIPNKSEYRDYTLYILINKNSESSNITLHSAESEDYNDFDNIIKSLQIPVSKMGVVLGFLSKNKKITKELVTDFKVKTGANKGAVCVQAGKVNSEKIFVDLGVKDEIIEKLKGTKLEKGEKLRA